MYKRTLTHTVRKPKQDQNEGKLPDVVATVYCPSLMLIIMVIQIAAAILDIR
jgi:hypothetical protein